MKNPERSVKTTAVGKAFGGFTDQERAATKELVQEDKADGKSAVLAKIAETPPVGFQSCVGSDGGHARTATTTRGNSVVHFHYVVHGREEQSTPGAPSSLLLEQVGPARWQLWVAAQSAGPIQEVAVIDTGIGANLQVSHDGHFVVVAQTR